MKLPHIGASALSTRRYAIYERFSAAASGQTGHLEKGLQKLEEVHQQVQTLRSEAGEKQVRLARCQCRKDRDELAEKRQRITPSLCLLCAT